MSNDNRINIIISARNEASAALSRVNSDLGRTGTAAGRLRGEMSLLDTVSSATFAGFAGAAVIGAAAREIISLADAYTLAEGRLRLVTSSSANLTAVQDQLYTSAQRTRTEYLSNVESFARLAQNTKDLHIAQSDLLTINETLNKAFIIGGATEAERSATMIQLSQAFSAGVLRGEEFNSVAEQGGRILQLLADYTGKTRGELKAMAEAGQLTGDVLQKAILTGTSKVNDEFGKMPTTVAQAGTMLKNTLGDLVSDANKATGATDGIAAAIRGIAVAIDENRANINSFFNDLANISARITSLPEQINKEMGDSINKFTEKITSPADVIRGRISFLRSEIESSSKWYNKSIFPDYNADMDYVSKVTAQIKDLESQLAKLQTSPYVTGEAGGKINLAAEAFKNVEFHMQGVQKQSESSMKITEKQRESWEKYTQTKEQSLAKERDLAMAGAKTDAERAAVEKKYQEELGKLHDKRGKSAESAAKKAETAAKKEQAAYQAIIDELLPLEAAQREYTEGLAAINKMDPSRSTDRYRTALEALNLKFDEAKEKAQQHVKAMRDAQQAAAESELSRKMTDIEISIATGSMSESEALPLQARELEKILKLQQDKLDGLAKNTPEEIDAWNSQAEAIKRTTLELAEYQQKLRLRDPFQAAKQGFIDYAETAMTSGESIRKATEQAMSSMTDAITKFCTTGKLEFSDLADSIISDLIKIQVQKSITGPLSSGLSSGVDWLTSLFSFNAIGGVYNTPGLSAYSNTVVNKPTIFPFASGIGMMGEAGAEAILPLTRTRGGALGVRSEGGGAVTVNIIGEQSKAGTTQQRSENGVNIIDVFVAQVKASIATDIARGSGQIPDAMANTYGLNRAVGRY